MTEETASMTNSIEHNEHLARVLERLPQSGAEAAALLMELSIDVDAVAQPAASQLVTLAANLAEIMALGNDQVDLGDAQTEIAEFLRSTASVLQESVAEPTVDPLAAGELVQFAIDRWGDWLELYPESATDWAPVDHVEEGNAELQSTDEDLALIMSALGSDGSEADDNSVETPGRASPEALITSPTDFPTAPDADSSLTLEPELAEAYLDDAGKCVASMETACLEFDQQPGSAEILRKICRELHTLKGASASVGLSQLADYLHRVEEFLEHRSRDGKVQLESAQLLQVVDAARAHVAVIAGAEAKPADRAAATTAIAPAVSDDATDETVRVKVSQLDRLMDMLAELVMLRNGRESQIGEIQRLNEELVRCATRIRKEGEDLQHATPSARPRGLREIANDVLEVSRVQRAVCDRISGENLAVSRFIRNFRQELTEARRLPVSGLFRRLQRAVQDAARSEQKKVRLTLVGEHAGLEKSVQERLYEPLLHIVRNSVSHGIEPESNRVEAGKSPHGTITLEARGSANLLILEIRDDGRGLDYEAIRRRGVERGLLSAEQPATRDELAQLIFHPGFSTRDTASAVSGRGVGMDVVADTLRRMRSWIEVDSKQGQGTTIRLAIPLRSVIEHAMVFRCGDQLFAVPMQSVQSAGDADEEHRVTLDGAKLLQRRQADDRPRQQLTVASGSRMGTDVGAGQTTNRECCLLVDEIVGPEEVVVRPLPALLRHQALVSGVSLSGDGQLVLLLDPFQLSLEDDSTPAVLPAQQTPARALVVDDSISARKALVHHLHSAGFETIEAADGRQALEALTETDVQVVFSDLEMPHMNGMELLAEVRAVETTAPPVIIVSSRTEAEYVQQASKEGAAAYLTKPASATRVIEELRRLGLPVK